MNTDVNVFFQMRAFLFSRYVPRIRWQLYLQFKEPPYCFSIVSAPTYIPTSRAQGSLSPQPLQIYCFRLFDGSHSNQHDVIPHCSFDLHFSKNQQCQASFMLAICVSSLEKCLIQVFCPLFNFYTELYEQQIGQPRRNGQVSRNTQPAKIMSRINR